MAEMLRVEEIAKKFNVSSRTVKRLIEKRELQALRVGGRWRVSEEWLEEWVARNTTDLKRDAG